MLGMLAGLLMLSMAVPVANGVSTSYLTTGLVQSNIKQPAIRGYDGVLVNYTHTYSSAFGAFGYLDLVNSAGQTVYWNVGGAASAPVRPLRASWSSRLRSRRGCTPPWCSQPHLRTSQSQLQARSK